jgi:aminoglycoside phosphotransferase (APT) family kinase protein
MGLVEIDDGYDFRVVVADERWVFRFPRRPGVVPALETEVALLPVIDRALPVRVPHFELVSEEPPFVAYRLIDGEPLADEDPAGVRAFLDALHAIPIDTLPLETTDWVASYREQCAEFERAVLTLLPVELHTQAFDLFAEVETLTGFTPSLVHADLGPEHLRVRGGRLAGVIDWGDARIGDPAIDYSWLLNGPFADWEVEPDLRRRARFYYRLGPWFEAHYGIFTGRTAHLDRGLAGIAERLVE